MRNYLSKTNNNDSFGFFGDAIGELFRPLFFDEKLDSMKTDIKETDLGYELEVEMPGFDKKDINLSLEDGYLTVRAEKKEAAEEGKKDRYLRKERSVSCQRSYYVGDISEESVKARYANGVLSLSVPKDEPKKPVSKSISIE